MRLTRTQAKEANRRALLDAACGLVATEGASVSLEAIAAAADLTTGAIYSIFGSKSRLLVAVLAEEISRVDVSLNPIHDPALRLDEVIDRYVAAWLETYSDYSKAQTAFELQVLLFALEDESLRRQLAEILEIELHQLVPLLENRVLDPSRPERRTTADESLAIAKAMKAVLTGFGLRQVVMDETSDVVRNTCRALATLVAQA